jgi:hypothetical protein
MGKFFLTLKHFGKVQKLKKSLRKLRGGPKVCGNIVPNLCKFDHPQP